MQGSEKGLIGVFLTKTYLDFAHFLKHSQLHHACHRSSNWSRKGLRRLSRSAPTHPLYRRHFLASAGDGDVKKLLCSESSWQSIALSAIYKLYEDIASKRMRLLSL